MERFREVIGVATDLDDVSRKLRDAVRRLDAGAVGAHQINCSDESERECVEIFHRRFVRDLLPELSFWERSSFRSVNLGGRYEAGSIAIAEDHYAIEPSADSFKVLVVKLNSHVSVVEKDGELIWGQMDRYERESVYCGAMHALMEGADAPFVAELEQTFGPERLANLRDPAKIARNQRELFAALVNANLQAARAVRDVLRVKSHTPTLYFIIPSVTLNRVGDDDEIVVGMHTIDERESGRPHEYVGLGSDPTRYQLKRGALELRVVET